MVQLALALPVGSATAEKSFSAMRRTRNWLRSTMGEERFSSLALLNIECSVIFLTDFILVIVTVIVNGFLF